MNVDDSDAYAKALAHIVERDPHLGEDLRATHHERKSFFASCAEREERLNGQNRHSRTSVLGLAVDAFRVSRRKHEGFKLDAALIRAVRSYAADPTVRELVETAVAACREHYRRGLE